MLKPIGYVVALLVFAVCTMAASPVAWTVSGATLSDGGAVTGCFVYDADTNTFSSVNVVTSGGANPGATYRFPDVSIASASLIAFVTVSSDDLTATPLIVLLPNTPLFNVL